MSVHYDALEGGGNWGPEVAPAVRAYCEVTRLRLAPLVVQQELSPKASWAWLTRPGALSMLL